MIAIKFKPVGKKHQGSFRVVVAEKRSKLRGLFIEDLGWYNPSDSTYHVNKERAQYWLSVGAQPTDTVHNLLVRGSVVRGKKISVHKTSKKSAETSVAEATPAVKAPAAEVGATDVPISQEAEPSEVAVSGPDGEPAIKESEQETKEETVVSESIS